MRGRIKLANISNKFFLCPDYIYKKIEETHGKYINSISGVDSRKITDDALNPKKAVRQKRVVGKYVSLENKKVLEIGSGLGVNLVVWIKKYNIDGFGLEPNTFGFNSWYKISRKLFVFNKLDKNRIINSKGEEIPFPDNHFDIVYSSNVLEHVKRPEKVIDEALRVLKPGGILQFIYPNFHSYFDGHYAVFHPPIMSKGFFVWYIRWVCRRDTRFAATLNTQLNLRWSSKVLKRLSKKYEFKILSYGDDVFFERMESLNFETWAGLTKVLRVLELLKKIRVIKLFTLLLVRTGTWSPIVMTIQKNS